MKLYSCRFAPCGRDPLHAVRASQPVWSDGRSVKECFHPDAFADTPTAEVPILVSHDPSRVAGSVTVKTAAADWHVADFILDGPYADQAAELIERTGGKVSPGFTGIDKDPHSARPPSPMDWYTAATLDEISLLEPGEIAGYQGAKVTRSVELAAPKPKRPPAPREVIHTPPEIILRTRSQQLDEEVFELQRRIDWHEAHRTGATFEQILENMRRELGVR